MIYLLLFFILFYLLLSLTNCLASPKQDSFKQDKTDNKKRKLISFKENTERKEERLDDSFSITSSVSPASTALSILRTPTAPDDFASPKTPTHSPQFFSFKRDNTSSSEEDEEYEYNEHNGHYKSDDNASTNTASSENMPKDDHLVSMMKKVAIAEKKPRKVIYEHEAVYFQDASHNKMVAIKVRLPSALLDEDIVINLKMKGNYQYLCICNKINQHFFSPHVTAATIGPLVNTHGRAWENFKHEQEVVQKSLRAAHGKCVPGGEEEQNLGEEEPVMSLFELKLDFVCDDLFDESLQPYPRTGHLFQRIMVPGKTRKKRDIECMTILSIVLVSKKKEEKKRAKRTPVKQDIYDLIQGLESDSDDDDDEGMRTPMSSL